MKKILALFLALTLVFALSACGNESESAKEFEDALDRLEDGLDELNDGITDRDELRDELDDAVDAMEDYADTASDAGLTTDMDIDEYVDMLIETDDWKTTKASVEAQNMTVEVEADGDSIIYKYTYTVEVDNEYTKSGIESGKDTLIAAADSLRAILSELDTVVYEYYDINGDLITSIEC